jgi:hypothetical protein
LCGVVKFSFYETHLVEGKIMPEEITRIQGVKFLAEFVKPSDNQKFTIEWSLNKVPSESWVDNFKGGVFREPNGDIIYSHSPKAFSFNGHRVQKSGVTEEDVELFTELLDRHIDHINKTCANTQEIVLKKNMKTYSRFALFHQTD